MSFVELVWWWSGIVWSQLPDVLIMKPLRRGFSAVQGELPFVSSLMPPGGSHKGKWFDICALLGGVCKSLCCKPRSASTSARLRTLWCVTWSELRPSTTYARIWLFSWSCIPRKHWLQLMPSLGPPDGSYNARWDRLPFVPDLGPLSKRYRAQSGQLMLVWGLCTF